MATYWFTANKAGHSFVSSQTETVEHTLGAGDTFETDDACDMVQFFNNWSADDGDTSWSEQQHGIVQQIYRACNPSASPDANPDEAHVIDVVAEPPEDGDDAEQQGAPAVDATGEVSMESSPDDLVSREPTDAVFDQSAPASPDDVADAQASDESSAEEIESLKDRWMRNQPDVGQPDPSHSDESTRRRTSGGDPVDLCAGVLWLRVTDLEVPAPILPLRLVRSYTSGRPYFGPWGFGWDHNYNSYCRLLADGGVARWRGELHEDIFRWTGSAFEPPRGVHERLERLPGPAEVYVVTHPGGLTFRFERPSDWSDAERIPLTRIHDRHNNAQFLTYNADNTLARVEDDDGRALIFHYGGCGLLEGLQDHTGRTVVYEHHPDIEHLVRVTLPATATYPLGASTSYDYDFMASHPAMRHNILRIADPDGLTYLQNQYGEPDDGWNFNRVTAQWSGGFVYAYEYEQVQYVPPTPAFVDLVATRTTVRPPDGSLHVYTFNYRGDLLDHRFRLIRDTSYRVIARQWKYDAQGNVVMEVRPDGSRTELSYDGMHDDPCARGNVLKVELFPAPAFPVVSRVVFQAQYEPHYQLVRETLDEAGRRTTLRYDFDVAPGPQATGRLVEVQLPDATTIDGAVQSSVIGFETNGRGQTVAVITPGGARHQRDYDLPAQLGGFLSRTVLDATGAAFTIDYEYDQYGFLRRTILPQGIAYEVHANALGQIEEMLCPAIDGSSAATRWRWDASGNLLRTERPRGLYSDPVIADDFLVDVYARNVLGYEEQTTIGTNTARPRTTSWCVNHEGGVLQIVDPAGLMVRRELDERGLLIEERVTPDRRHELTSRFVYDSDGRLISHRTPGGPVTEIQRDPWGRVHIVTLSNGSTETYTWGVVNRLQAVRIDGDPGDGGPPRLLASTTFEYDERGRLTRERVASFRDDSQPEVTLELGYLYNRDGYPIEIRAPGAGTTTAEYDGLGRVVRVTDALGNAEVTTYDPPGRVVRVDREEVEPPNGHRSLSWTYAYDDRDRMRSLTPPGGQTLEFRYDDRDLVVERTEPLGVVVRTSYGLGEEVEEVRVDPDGLAITTRQEFDTAGRLIRLIDPTGEVTTWTRDRLGRQTSVTLPDGRTWTRAFGPLGTVVRERAPSLAEFTYDYDTASGRLIAMHATAGAGAEDVPTHTYAYDGMNRLVRAQVAGAAVERKYDSLGRIVEETAAGRVVRRDFDDTARTVDLTCPDGRVERAELDAAGRVTRVTLLSPGLLGGTSGDELARLTYGGTARLLGIALQNGVESRIAYDETGRPIRVEHASAGTILQSSRYLYDARNRRRVVQHINPPRLDEINRFDTGDRLVQVRRAFALTDLADAHSQADHDAAIDAAETAAATAAWTQSFVVDHAGSRHQAIVSGDVSSVTTFDYAPSHQLSAVDGQSVAHHPDGSRSADARYVYDVDTLGRTLRIRDSASAAILAEFKYDPLSRVASGELSGIPFMRSFIDDTWIHEEANGVVSRQRTPGVFPNVPFAERRAGQRLSPHIDASLSAVAVSDESGAIIERIAYAPFGTPTFHDASGTVVLPGSAAHVEAVYGGMLYLAGVGVYQTFARLYEPETGLFLSRDPLLYQGGASPYLYARHNPVDFADPDGAAPHVLAGVIAGGAIGAVGAWLHGGDAGDIVVGFVAGAAGGAVAASTLNFALAGAVAGGISGAWSGGKAGYASEHTVTAALGGGTYGALWGGAIGAVAGRIGGAVGDRVATHVSGTVFRSLSSAIPGIRASDGMASYFAARNTSMLIGGYAGGFVADVSANTLSSATVNLLAGRPVITPTDWEMNIASAVMDAPLNAAGAWAVRAYWVRSLARRSPNNPRKTLGDEGEWLVARRYGITPGGERFQGESGYRRILDFPSKVTRALFGEVWEVKNAAMVGGAQKESRSLQLPDMAIHAKQLGARLRVFHRPGAEIDSELRSFVVDDQDLVIHLQPIPQQPFVIAVPGPRNRPMSVDKK